MTSRILRAALAGAGFCLVAALGVATPVSYHAETGKIGWNSAEARRGADDPANHDVGDDRGRGRGRGSDSSSSSGRRGR